MGNIIAKQITPNKYAKHCQGCGLFAACEELKLKNGKLWLCGNCFNFCRQTADVIIGRKMSAGQVAQTLRKRRAYLRKQRRNCR